MSFDSLKGPTQASGVFPRRALTISGDDSSNFTQMVTVYLYCFNPDSSDQRLKIEFHKRSTTHELIDKILQQKAECLFLVGFLVQIGIFQCFRPRMPTILRWGFLAICVWICFLDFWDNGHSWRKNVQRTQTRQRRVPGNYSDVVAKTTIRGRKRWPVCSAQ